MRVPGLRRRLRMLRPPRLVRPTPPAGRGPAHREGSRNRSYPHRSEGPTRSSPRASQRLLQPSPGRQAAARRPRARLPLQISAATGSQSSNEDQDADDIDDRRPVGLAEGEEARPGVGHSQYGDADSPIRRARARVRSHWSPGCRTRPTSIHPQILPTRVVSSAFRRLRTRRRGTIRAVLEDTP